MSLIVGHSQVKYLHQYIESDSVFTLCYPGYTILDIVRECAVFDAVEDVSVSTTFYKLFILLWFTISDRLLRL